MNPLIPQNKLQNFSVTVGSQVYCVSIRTLLTVAIFLPCDFNNRFCLGEYV